MKTSFAVPFPNISSDNTLQRSLQSTQKIHENFRI